MFQRIAFFDHSKKIAADITIDGINYKLDHKKLTAEIVGCQSHQENIVIPRFVTKGKYEYIITAIKEDSFEKSQLKSLNFSKDSQLRLIEKNSFINSQIEKIYIPESVDEIQEKWCQSTPNLYFVDVSPKNKNFILLNGTILLSKSNKNSNEFDTILFISKSVTILYVPSFIKFIPSINDNYLNVKECIFADDSKINKFKRGSFSYSKIERVKIPSSIEKIGKNAFNACKSLRVIEIPENSQLKSFGEGSFYNTSIESIKIPEKVTRIKKDAFSHTERLKSIEFSINSQLKSIEKFTFLKSSLQSITIPSSVVEIQQGAFYYSKLKFVNFSEDSKLQFIEKYSFANSDILSFSLPSSVIKIDEYAFFQCHHLKSFSIHSDSKLQKLGNECFSETQINELFIPKSLGNINEGFFANMSNLSKIILSEDNENMIVYDNKIVIEKSKEEENDAFDIILLAYCNIESIEIPSFIKEIGEFSFSKCQELKHIYFSDDSSLVSINKGGFCDTIIENISLPKGVTKICEDSFKNCHKLKYVNFSELSFLEILGKNAFYKTNLRAISLPSSVTKIEDDAFSYCENLEVVNFAKNSSSLVSIGNNAFSYTKIKNFDILPSVLHLGKAIFTSCKYLGMVDIPINLKINNVDGLFSFSSVRSVILPQQINSLDSYAFSNCIELVFFEFLSDEISLLEKSCFYKCHKLSIISFPNCKKINYSTLNEISIFLLNFYHVSYEIITFYCYPHSLE